MKKKLILIFREFLKRENLNEKNILLMVSGGVDSMTLLEIACTALAPEKIFVAHVDHNYTKNSNKNLELVQKICTKKGVQCFAKKLEKQPQKSRENNWRKARQIFAKEIEQQVQAERILTAHHATDLVETMLFRLIKGAGVGGMNPLDARTKPFLGVSRAEIEDFAKTEKLEFYDDPSNKNLEFDRNKIRSVLPIFREINPNLEKVFLREADFFSNTDEVHDFLYKKIVQEQINLSEFLEFPNAVQKLFLWRWTRKKASEKEILDCLKWLQNSPRGKSFRIVSETKITLINGFLVREP